MSQESEDDVPVTSDISAFVNSQDDTERAEVVAPDGSAKVWFEFRDLSWKEKEEIKQSNSFINDDGQPELDVVSYVVDCLRKKCVDSSVDSPNAFFEGMNNEVGEQLQEYVPDPVDMEKLEEAEVKN